MYKHLIAAAAAAAALTIAAPTTPAHAIDGTFTQLLCANPATGQSVGAADGLTYTSSTGLWWAGPGSTGCGEIIPQTSGSATDGAYAAIRYSVDDPTLSIVSAEHWSAMSGVPGTNGYLYLRQPGAGASNDVSEATGDDSGAWLGPTNTIAHGDRFSPFAVANHHVTLVDSTHFTMSVVCKESSLHPGCDHDALSWDYLLFGARIVLRDSAAPTVTAATGQLASATSLTDSATASISATDAGAGLTSWRLYDGPSLIQGGSLTNCQDLGPDTYASQHPCPASVTKSPVSADVGSLQEGNHHLRLTVADAGGNETTAIDRTVTVDNVPDPRLVSDAPSITGTPAVGQPLSGFRGAWITSTPLTYAYSWERCASASTCTPIPNASTTAYVPTTDDAGSYLRLSVTARNSAGETTTERSALTSIVPRAAVSAPPPATTTTVAPAVPAPPSLTTAPAADPILAPRADARITLTLSRRHLAYAQATTATGRVTTAAGLPIAGATVTITAAEARPGAPARPLRTATTRADGSFSATVTHGPSRRITATYGAASATTSTIVLATATIRAGTARVNRTTWLTGRLGHLGRKGVKLEVQALDGKRWRTFDTTTTKSGGAFSYGYRFHTGSAGRTFALRVLIDDPLYPFARGASKAVRVHVRAS